MRIAPDALAKLEEARLSQAITDLADETLDVGGGRASWGGAEGSWMNQVTALGMSGPIAEDALDRVEAFYAGRTREPEIGVCPFADPSVLRACRARGYVLRDFETVLYRDLEAPPPVILPDGVTLEPVEDEAAREAFLDCHVACFAPEGGERAAALREGARRMLDHPKTVAWNAQLEGEVIGGASVELHAHIGTLIAGCVRPAFRRRGVQQALVAHRIEVARAHGCAVVTVGSAPDSATGRNALRAGFVTAYTRATLMPPS